MENLINDLLDLAKMQNNSFKLSKDYFSLSNVVYEAFQMLMFSANEKGIELKAEIDQIDNLNNIDAIHGDQNRFL
jgi:signal transduction histidine kinase